MMSDVHIMFVLCRCGSVTHLKISHSACPLNPKRRRDADGGEAAQPKRVRVSRARAASGSDSSDSSSSGSEDVLLRDMIPLPFAIGTKVAVKFSGKVYKGKVTKLLTDPATAMVLFEDGDEAEYDADEIREAMALYESECNKSVA